MRYIGFALCGLVLAGSVGCASAPVASAPVDGASKHIVLTQQLILRFDDRRNEAAARASLDTLSEYAGQGLLYVRPMSGDAHVLRPVQPLDSAAFDALLLKLRSAPGVAYVEPDRLMRAH